MSWLGNFLPEDRPTAVRLLDGIRFARLSTMRSELLRLLEALDGSGEIGTPAVLVPTLSQEDIGATKVRHIAYDNYDVGKPIESLPGSEGFVGNLVRQLVARAPERWLPPTAELTDLRASRCRSIVLVTDYSGSGTQLANFARTFVRNPTIRSWRSGALVRIHAVTFAISTEAQSHIARRDSPIDFLWSVGAAQSFADRPWTSEELAAVEHLCMRSTPSRHRKEALGYKASRGLFAMETGAPNNLPWLLRRPRDDKWSPFFDGRHVPPDLADEIGDYVPTRTGEDLEVLTGQARLSHAIEERAAKLRPTTSDLLWVLALLNRRRMDDVELAATMGTDSARTQQLIATLIGLGLVDTDRKVTPLGLNEIRAGKRSLRRVKFDLAPREGDYYPKAMR